MEAHGRTRYIPRSGCTLNVSMLYGSLKDQRFFRLFSLYKITIMDFSVNIKGKAGPFIDLYVEKGGITIYGMDYYVVRTVRRSHNPA